MVFWVLRLKKKKTSFKCSSKATYITGHGYTSILGKNIALNSALSLTTVDFKIQGLQKIFLTKKYIFLASMKK